MDAWLENLKSINTNETFLGGGLVYQTGGAMHKVLSDQETEAEEGGELENTHCWSTYDRGEPASSLGSQPGWEDEEGWAEDSTDGGC